MHAGSWFTMNIADLALPEGGPEHDVGFLIGETDEYISKPRLHAKSYQPAAKTIAIEDMIYANAARHWVTGATYVEAEQAGLADADIIDLLYRDILGRPADPDGLSAYMFQRRQGIRSFDDIKKSLLESEEYRQRPKRAAEAPGAVFSQAIVLLAATAAELQEDVPASASDVRPAPARSGLGALRPARVSADRVSAAAAQTWPVYPERRVQAPAASAENVAGGLEIQLPIDSVLFGAGWHNVEYVEGAAFRWMERSGTVFSPKPGLACTAILLEIAAVYGAHEPMLECFFDDEAAEVVLSYRESGFLVKIRPRGFGGRVFTKLQIESRASGCPLQDDRGQDDRVLSLNVVGITAVYL
jgi:hypothetical protein